MKCPKELRVCPHGWTDCSLCANLSHCSAGTYEPEPKPEPEPEPDPPVESDLDIVIRAAEISERVTHAEAVQSAQYLKRDLFSEFMAKSPEETRRIVVTEKSCHMNYKEPITCMSGPTEPGGGSKSKAPKKPQKKTPEYMKILGM